MKLYIIYGNEYDDFLWEYDFNVKGIYTNYKLAKKVMRRLYRKNKGKCIKNHYSIHKITINNKYRKEVV